jgi:hypothetical protein
VTTYVRGPLHLRHCTGSARILDVGVRVVDASGDLGARGMKAFILEKYGPPEMLRMAEVVKPAPAADEALVKVLAVSVNPADWRSMRAKPFLLSRRSRVAAAKT